VRDPPLHAFYKTPLFTSRLFSWQLRPP
jgi:hypothetical protein